jgi:hypothetical protein
MAVRWMLGLLVVCLVALGCDDHSHEDDHDHDAGHDEGDHSHDIGDNSGATCPTDNTLDYDNFGKGFMDAYCTRCHSSELEGDARNDAPEDHDFDSLIGVLSVSKHIDQYAAAGPDAVNTMMPPDGDKPTEAERRKLGQWLACELEAIDSDAGSL